MKRRPGPPKMQTADLVGLALADAEDLVRAHGLAPMISGSGRAATPEFFPWVVWLRVDSGVVVQAEDRDAVRQRRSRP